MHIDSSALRRHGIAGLFLGVFVVTLVLESYWTGKAYNLAMCLSLASLLLALSGRIAFSAAAASFVCSWIWAISEIKFRYLGLRLVPVDFTIAASAWQAIFPFAATGLALTFLSIAALATIWWAESAFRVRRSPGLWGAVILSAIPWVAANAARQVHLALPMPYAHALPIFVQGAYRLHFSDPRIGKPTFCCRSADRVAENFTRAPDDLPDLVVILSESLFDPGRIEGFHNRARVPDEFVPLKVYTVGGQSWVQEIALLHGVPPPKYGSDWPEINLYVSDGKLDGRLARMLAAQGYQATTVYSVDRNMYGARSMHQVLGISRFIDCAEVPGCMGKSWQARHDALFFNAAARLIESSAGPQFVFLNTIRQHSPHNSSLAREEERCQKSLSDAQCSVLEDFDNRLGDSLNEYDALLDRLRKRSKRSVVALFGDHIPSDVAYYFGEEAFRDHDRLITVFDLWDSRRGHITKAALARHGVAGPVEVSFLDALLLAEAGFESVYLRDKLEFMQAGQGAYRDPGEH